MIPVELKPEPENFDKDVRQKGFRWLADHNISTNEALPKNAPKSWQNYNAQLHRAYDGICAYYAYFFEFQTGAETDHFIPKSQNAGLAYEWNNYRLACSGANKKKGVQRILDPITELKSNTFLINLFDGTVLVNRKLEVSEEYFELADATIMYLDLNNTQHKKMRIRHFEKYEPQLLKELNPFVYYEAERQGLL